MSIRRRQFITLLGGAAAAWPIAARAQQPSERLRHVGVLMGNNEGDVSARGNLAALRDALQKLGWIEGRNVELHVRWAGADGERRHAYAVEIVARSPDVILTSSGPVTRAVQAQTTTTPIVMASGGDIVAGGVIANLARPEGNITGFPATEHSLAGKWLELLKALAPSATRIAVIQAPENPGNAEYWRAAERAAKGRVAEMAKVEAGEDAQIGRAIDEFVHGSEDALLVLPGASTIVHRDAIVAAAARHRLPAVYPFRLFAESGGLMSYGADQVDIFRRAAVYVDRILRGEKLANLPVQMPTKFELVINLKTAKALGLTVPPNLLATADEVIE